MQQKNNSRLSPLTFLEKKNYYLAVRGGSILGQWGSYIWRCSINTRLKRQKKT